MVKKAGKPTSLSRPKTPITKSPINPKTHQTQKRCCKVGQSLEKELGEKDSIESKTKSSENLAKVGDETTALIEGENSSSTEKPLSDKVMVMEEEIKVSCSTPTDICNMHVASLCENLNEIEGEESEGEDSEGEYSEGEGSEETNSENSDSLAQSEEHSENSVKGEFGDNVASFGDDALLIEIIELKKRKIKSSDSQLPVKRRNTVNAKSKEMAKDRRPDFLTRTVLRGKLIPESDEKNVNWLLARVTKQGWEKLFVDKSAKSDCSAVVEFFINCIVVRGVVTSMVNNKKLQFDAKKLGAILKIPCDGFSEYKKQDWPYFDDPLAAVDITRKFSGDIELDEARKVFKREMTPFHQHLFSFVIRNIVPRSQGRGEATFLDLTLMEFLESGKAINFPSLMVQHIARVAISEKKSHPLPYGFLLAKVFEYFEVPNLCFLSAGPSDKLFMGSMPFSGKKGIKRLDGVDLSRSRASDGEIAVLKREIVELRDENSNLRDLLLRLNEKFEEATEQQAKKYQDLFTIVQSALPKSIHPVQP